MLELLSTFVGEIAKLILDIEPKVDWKRAKKMKLLLAKLYFLLTDWQETGYAFIQTLEETVKANDQWEYSDNIWQSLWLLKRINQIIIEMADLLVLKIGKSNSLSELIAFEEWELARRMWDILGAKEQRITKWVGLLDTNSTNIKNSMERLFPISDSTIGVREFPHAKLLALNQSFASLDEVGNVKREINNKEEFHLVELDIKTIQQEIKTGRKTLQALDKLLQDYKAFLYKHVTMEDLI